MKKNQTSSESIAQKRFPEAGSLERIVWEHERIKRAIEGIECLVEVSESIVADAFTNEVVNVNLDIRTRLKGIINQLENRLARLEISMPPIPEQRVNRESFLENLRKHFNR